MCKRDLDRYFELCKPYFGSMSVERQEERDALAEQVKRAYGNRYEFQLWDQAKTRHHHETSRGQA
jgi:hypothetical protein